MAVPGKAKTVNYNHDYEIRTSRADFSFGKTGKSFICFFEGGIVMRIRRIAFLDPGSAKRIVSRAVDMSPAPDQIGINQRSHEPIGSCYVASWAQSRGFEVDVVSPHTTEISLETILRINPDMVGFSTLTYNHSLAEEAAKLVKQADAKIVTVIGGYHATCLPAEISQKRSFNGALLFDFVVEQEADCTAADLAEHANGNRTQDQIRGRVWREGKVWANNFQRIDPNTNPIPYRTPEMMRNCRRYGLYYPAPSQQQAVALMVGSRGCPFNCKFCLSKRMFPASGNISTFYRNPENIIQEIETLRDQFGTNAVFFVDLDFYGLDKKRIGSLCARLAETRMNWFAMSRVTAGSLSGTDFDPEIFQMMKAGGCTQIGLGVESLVRKFKSGVRLSISGWQELVRKLTDYLHGLGILSKGYFILGDFGDTLDDLAAEEAAIMRSGFDDIRLSWMMYSPGTVEYEDVKKANGFVTDDFSLFSTDYPVIKVADAAPKRLQEIRRNIQRHYYSRPEYARQAAEMTRRNLHLSQSFREWDGILVKSLGQGFLSV